MNTINDLEFINYIKNIHCQWSVEIMIYIISLNIFTYISYINNDILSLSTTLEVFASPPLEKKKIEYNLTCLFQRPLILLELQPKHVIFFQVFNFIYIILKIGMQILFSFVSFFNVSTFFLSSPSVHFPCFQELSF